MRRDLLGWPGAPLAIASAVLFGASTPFAKLLLGEGISPWLLAGLLYLGLASASASFIWDAARSALLRRKRRSGRRICPGWHSSC